MKLNVPLVLQDKDSKDCGLAGLCMILSYHNQPTTIDKIKEEVQLFKVGTYIPQLGSYLIKQGFAVEIITMNPHIFTLAFQNKTQEEILNHFKEYKPREQDKIPLQHFIEFMEIGGRVTPKIPTFADFEEEIAAKRPVLTTVTADFLTQQNPCFDFHAQLVTGIDKTNIFVNDPMWNTGGGEKIYSKEIYKYAMYANAYGDIDNACIMKIRKLE